MIVTFDYLGDSKDAAAVSKLRDRAHLVFGQLAKRVSRLNVVLRVCPQDDGVAVYRCNVRLGVPGFGDLLVETQRPSKDPAIHTALRRARRELLRRPALIGDARTARTQPSGRESRIRTPPGSRSASPVRAGAPA